MVIFTKHFQIWNKIIFNEKIEGSFLGKMTKFTFFYYLGKKNKTFTIELKAIKIFIFLLN